MATCFSTEQCARIVAPASEAASPKIGLQRKFPRDVLCGPQSAQGVDLHNIEVTQPIEHLDAIMRHSGRFLLMGTLLDACVEGLKLEMGVSGELWNLEVGKWEGGRST